MSDGIQANAGERWVDIFSATFCLVLLMPIICVNFFYALLKWQKPLERKMQRDDLGRSFAFWRWRRGPLQQTAGLLSILMGQMSWCGISYGRHIPLKVRTQFSLLPVGVFSLYRLQARVGYIGMDVVEAIAWHESHRGIKTHCMLLLRATFNYLLYSRRATASPSNFQLLGVNVHNLDLTETLRKVAGSFSKSCQKIYFINVNSLNLAFRDSEFRACLNRANTALIDGSGVRIGASFKGISLKANVNGTDLLPHLCQHFNNTKASVYFLGAAPGVAASAARVLIRRYPGLNIVGVRHGFFSNQESEGIVDEINASGADYLLVGLGSPMQEMWIDNYAHRLCARSALAVGGLFDFYSGRLPRAPRWMCELGLEWIYRFWQEPSIKFHRYVIGNPVFLWRAWRLRCPHK